jgi:hypothetical protein
MTNYRVFLLSFLTVSWVFLGGFKEPVDNDTLAVEEQKTAVEPEAFETERILSLREAKQMKAKSNVKPVMADPQKSEQTTSKGTTSDPADDNNSLQRNEFEKPLDLSVPFKDKDAENAELKVEQKPAAQNRVTNIFAPDAKKKPRPVEVDSGFLMSPEPEPEKLKSVDGAGIVIKLKP